MRTSYKRAKNELLESSRSGAGRDKIAKPKYWLYKQLDRFLAPHVVDRQSRSNMVGTK